jgi:hypothetical protein
MGFDSEDDMGQRNVTEEVYNNGWEIYRAKRSIKAVARGCEVSYKTARRMTREGYPDRKWEAYELRLAKIMLAASSAIPRNNIQFTREVLSDLKYMLQQATEQLLEYRDGLVLSEMEIKSMTSQQFVNMLQQFVGITEHMAKLEAFVEGRPEKTTKVTVGIESDEDPSTWSDDRLQEFLSKYGIKVEDKKKDDKDTSIDA